MEKLDITLKDEPPIVDMDEIFLALYCMKPVLYRDLYDKSERWKKEFGPPHRHKDLCKL